MSELFNELSGMIFDIIGFTEDKIKTLYGWKKGQFDKKWRIVSISCLVGLINQNKEGSTL